MTAAFNPDDYDEELSYDFSKYGKSETEKESLRGVTPEPSTAQVLKYQKAMRKAAEPIYVKRAEYREEGRDELDETKLTADQVREMIADDGSELALGVLEDSLRATAEVCSNHPSKSDLNKLPHRMKMHYVGYIAGKFLSGEASTPATTS